MLPEILASRTNDYRRAILEFWMPWKCYSCRDVSSWIQCYIASIENLYSILANWKCDYSSVMRPPTHMYVASSMPLFGLLVASKLDRWKVMSYVTVRVFDGLKIRIVRFPEILCSRLRDYLWAHVLHFGGLKMWFLAVRETVSSSLQYLF